MKSSDEKLNIIRNKYTPYELQIAGLSGALCVDTEGDTLILLIRDNLGYSKASIQIPRVSTMELKNFIDEYNVDFGL